MSKKRKFYFKYNIMVNGEEYTREYTIEGTSSLEAAETKLMKMCSEPIVIITKSEI